MKANDQEPSLHFCSRVWEVHTEAQKSLACSKVNDRFSEMRIHRKLGKTSKKLTWRNGWVSVQVCQAKQIDVYSPVIGNHGEAFKWRNDLGNIEAISRVGFAMWGEGGFRDILCLQYILVMCFIVGATGCILVPSTKLRNRGRVDLKVKILLDYLLRTW